MLFQFKINAQANPNAPCQPGQIGSGLSLPPITTPTIWNGSDMQIYNDVIIEPGASLTIQNITVFFTGRTRIIVKRGAKLVIDGAILTAVCDFVMWEGIEVWGNPSITHPTVSVLTATNYQPSLQENGLVIVKNSSEIQHAGNGIKTVKVLNFGTANQTRDLGYVNGIALVSDSKFYNNGCSMVMFGNYMDVVSNVSNTDFIVDQNFHDPNQVYGTGATPQVQIFMQKIKGFKVSNGSVFDNQIGIGGGGWCIQTYNSSFTIENGNNFYNWSDAIWSLISVPNPSIGQVFITGNTFENNFRSILLEGYDQDLMINDFNINISYNNIRLAQLQSNENYGIDLHGCANYNVENNFIDGGGDFTYGEGIVLIASQPSNICYVQKNRFGTNPPASYEVGIRTFSKNETTQLLCNFFYG